MPRPSFPTHLLVLLAIYVGSAVAAYDQIFFSSNNSNNNHFCNRASGFPCKPPSICVHERNTDKWYCCATGSDEAICNTGMNVNCAGSNDEASPNQIQCLTGTNAFCCLKDVEQCTLRRNQINVCWATAPNPVANLTEKFSNATFSSLSSASPSATAYSINLSSLLSSASSTPTPSPSASGSASGSVSPSAPSASSSASPSASPSESPLPSNDDSSSGLSGGAIGGIVGGVIGGLALLGAIAFLLWRRKRSGANSLHSPSMHEHSPQDNPYMRHDGYQQAAVEAPDGGHYIAEAPATQKYAQHGELYTDVPTGASEVHQSAPVEMPGTMPERRY